MLDGHGVVVAVLLAHVAHLNIFANVIVIKVMLKIRNTQSEEKSGRALQGWG